MTSTTAVKTWVQGTALMLGLLLASAEHDLGASSWCWAVNLAGLGLVWLVALTQKETT